MDGTKSTRIENENSKLSSFNKIYQNYYIDKWK